MPVGASWFAARKSRQAASGAIPGAILVKQRLRERGGGRALVALDEVPYTSLVTAMLACPRISETTLQPDALGEHERGA
jgi:hypothetical protein